MSAPAFVRRVPLGPAMYVRLPLPLHEKVRGVAQQSGVTYADAIRAIVEAWASEPSVTEPPVSH